MGMPGKIVTKGSISAKADAMANYPNLQERMAFLKALEESQMNYADILIEQSKKMLHLGVVTDDEANLLRSKWFNSNGKGWWKDNPAQGALEWILRQSLIQAMKVAQEGREKNPLLVDSYWICGVAHLEVIVTRSNNQVTRIMLTPGIREDLPIIPDDLDEDIWVIRPNQERNDAERFVEQPIEVNKHGVQTVRLRKTKSQSPKAG